MPEGSRSLTVIYPRTMTEENPPKRRVAAYCRVSTQAEEQNHSLAAQISYYTKLILKRLNDMKQHTYPQNDDVLLGDYHKTLKSYGIEAAPFSRLKCDVY